MHKLRNNVLVCIISICITVTAPQEDYTASWENKDVEDKWFSDKFISMNGALRRTFALVAAIDHDKRNMICSPLSALLPLGKLAIGAKEDALDELLITIGIGSKGRLKDHFVPLIDDLKYLPGVNLEVASRLYVSKYATIQRKFIDRARSIFDSSVEKVDFGMPGDAANIINDWVSKKTNGLIRHLISPRDIYAGSSMVVVNAIHFSGRWKEPFQKVELGTFMTPTDTRRVPMMTKMSWYKYIRSNILGAQLIEIPYEGQKSSFVMLLPYKNDGLPALVSQLKIAPELLDAELHRMRKVKVVLTMPKFKIQSTLDLKNIYEKIGLRDIFKTENSGLKGIVKDTSVYVSSATQKAVIEVNEFGTEAAAASVINISKLLLDIPITYKADHPFMFFVVSQKEQLFSGTLIFPDEE